MNFCSKRTEADAGRGNSSASRTDLTYFLFSSQNTVLFRFQGPWTRGSSLKRSIYFLKNVQFCFLDRLLFYFGSSTLTKSLDTMLESFKVESLNLERNEQSWKEPSEVGKVPCSWKVSLQLESSG